MSRIAYHGTFTDGNGAVITSGSVGVYLSGGSTVADVYASSSGGSSVNSITTDSVDGSFVFYVDFDDYPLEQRFKIALTKAGYTTKYYDNISILVNPPLTGYYEGSTYYPAVGESDHGVSSGNVQTVYDILTTVGTSAKANVVFRHTGSSSTTRYLFDTSFDMESYDNIRFYFESGARLRQVTGDEVVRFYSSELISALPDQVIADGSILGFGNATNLHPGWWGEDSLAIAAACDAADGLTKEGCNIPLLSRTYEFATGIISLSRGVNLVGTHTPNQFNPSDATLTHSGGTIFRRNANIEFITIAGSSRTTDRVGKNLISGICFITDEDDASDAAIDAVWGDNVIIERCSFYEDDDSTTVGHMIDVEECWDWTLRDCVFKQYGSATKFAVNLYNGGSSYCNNWLFDNCKFYNGNGKAIVSDAGGAGSTRNSFITVRDCKFEDSDDASPCYISGPLSHVIIDGCHFLTGDDNHVEIDSVGDDWLIQGNTFQDLGDTPTEYIHIDSGSDVKILGNNFSGIGAATTGFIKITGSGGTSTRGIIIADNTIYEGTLYATPIVTTSGTMHPSIDIRNNGDYQRRRETAETPAISNLAGTVLLHGYSNAVAATLADGLFTGDKLTVMAIDISNAVTLTVANHETSDPEVFTFPAVGDWITLIWGTTQWHTYASDRVTT